MGIFLSKFLNTATHFSVNEYYALSVSSMGGGLTRYSGVNGEVNTGPTESDFQQMVSGNITIVRIVAKANLNSLAGTDTISFRDDGVSVASVVIPAGSTAIIDSGAISVNVASASLIDLEHVIGAGAGAIDQIAVTIQYLRAIA